MRTPTLEGSWYVCPTCGTRLCRLNDAVGVLWTGEWRLSGRLVQRQRTRRHASPHDYRGLADAQECTCGERLAIPG